MQPTQEKTQVSQTDYNNLADWAKPSYSVAPTPQPQTTVATPPSAISMTPESLQSTPLVKVPQVRADTTSAGVIAGTQPDYNLALQNAEKAQQAVGTQAQDAQSALTRMAENIFGQKADAQANQVNIENNLGIQEQQKALGEINTEIANEQLRMRGEMERIREGTGSEAQKAISRNTINDTYGRRLADLAIRQSAANQNISAIQANAERQTKLLTAPLDTKIQYLSTFAKDNVDFLNTQQQQKLSLVIDDIKSQKADIQNLQKIKTDLTMEIANNGGGANTALIARLQAARTPEEASAIAAQSGYVGKLDRQLKQAQLNKIYSDIRGTDSPRGLSEALNKYSALGDPAINKEVLASILSGKQVSAGTKGRLAPSNAVLNALDEFAAQRQDGKFVGMGGVLGFAKLKEGVKGLFNQKDPEAIQNAQSINSIKGKVEQWYSGASLTEEQLKSVKKMIPNTWDSDKEIQIKTSGLYNYMLNQVESELLTDGVNVNFAPVDLFGKTIDPLGVANNTENATTSSTDPLQLN